MKKIFTLFLLMIALLCSPLAHADGPVVVDAIYDLAIAGFESADRIFVGTDGTYANRLGEVTIDGDDLSAVDGSVDGRALRVATQEITASGNGTADTMGIYDVDTTTVLAYWPITSKVLASGQTYSFAQIDPITIRDVTTTP